MINLSLHNANILIVDDKQSNIDILEDILEMSGIRYGTNTISRFANQFKNLVKSASGKQLKIEWTAHKLFDEKGILTGIITIGENITKL